jgi:hypothetical protein
MNHDQPKSEPSIPLENSDGDLVTRLETLDDIIFPAIDGDPEALDASGPAWHEAVEELGIEAIQETRCEYLRYADNVWQFLKHQTVQQPLRMLAVMKIIGMLMGDDV